MRHPRPLLGVCSACAGSAEEGSAVCVVQLDRCTGARRSSGFWAASIHWSYRAAQQVEGTWLAAATAVPAPASPQPSHAPERVSQVQERGQLRIRPGSPVFVLQRKARLPASFQGARSSFRHAKQRVPCHFQRLPLGVLNLCAHRQLDKIMTCCNNLLKSELRL